MLQPLLALTPLLSLVALASVSTPVRAQDEPPSDLETIELERSRTCVDVLSRLEDLDVELRPLASHAQRLLAIAGAIDIEEEAIVDSLDVSDPLEAAVRDWFAADAELARRYLDEQSQEVLETRAEARRAIQERVALALDDVQAQADSVMAPSGDLRAQAASCSGAILVRSAALEACASLTSRVCQAARDSTVQSPFRFVDAPELLWYRQEFRPWTTPGPLQLGPNGQLGGARTVGSTRVGNVVVSVSFNPLFRAREQLGPEELAMLDSINGSLEIESTHPDLAFAPALAIQATLPRALGGEDEYIVHFGPPEAPDVVWAAQADTGVPLVGSVALAPEHVARLVAGDPLTLTAIGVTETGEPEIVYLVELTSVNQVTTVRTLLGYMSGQLSADLARLIPPEDP